MKREGEVTVYLRLVKSKSTLLKKVESANLLALINLTAFASKGRGWSSCGGECGLPMFNSAGTPKLRSFAQERLCHQEKMVNERRNWTGVRRCGRGGRRFR